MKLSEKDQKILDFFVNIMDKEDNEILLADLEKKNPPYPILDLESSQTKIQSGQAGIYSLNQRIAQETKKEAKYL